VVSTLAGSGAQGSADGTGTAASFYSPWGVAVDPCGNVYVADSGYALIRKVTPAGVVSTLAGSGSWGFANGTGTGASFSHPSGVAVNSSGNVFVVDTNNSMIRLIQ
jgi:streptogramin lyase